MTPDRTVTINGVTYFIRFGRNAIFLLERYLDELEEITRRRTGRSARIVPVKKITETDPGFVEASGLALLAFMSDDQIAHLLFWAGVEGGRLRHRPSMAPITFEAAGNLIDDAGGIPAIRRETLLAYDDAFPNNLPQSIIDTLKAVEETAPVKRDESKNESTDRTAETRRSSKRSRSVSP